MNKYFTMLAVAMLGTTATQAETEPKIETFWANGVSAESGWYDANKTHDDDPQRDSQGEKIYTDEYGVGAQIDDNLCYAASTANLLAWWQNQYEPVDGVPQGVDAIWQTFVENSLSDSGGTVTGALQWWITGMDDTVTELGVGVGYYKSYTTGENLLDLANGGTFISRLSNATGEALAEALYTGKGVSLFVEGPIANHSVTLWGLELKDGALSKMWITDSDDYAPDLAPTLHEVTVTGNSYDLDGATYRIEKAFTINPGISDEWGLVKATGGDSVPEPTTATLSLLALGALAMRRRRH